MSEKDQTGKKLGISLDWLIGGVLTKVGETLDRFTGRGWNPSSSLATSKLIEKLKFLLDEEARAVGSGRFAPHIITLKIQWNKFASDTDGDLEKLADELHAAAIDHINDSLYHTFAPIEIDIKNDYFTEGVRLIGSFGEFGEADEEASINVTVPEITIEKSGDGSRASINLDGAAEPEPVAALFSAIFEINGKTHEKKLDFSSARRYSIGRGSSNDLALQDESVSNVHATLVMNSEGKLLVADTGSTNGTYVSGRRIPYGKAYEVETGQKISFGTVDVELKDLRTPPAPPDTELLPADEVHAAAPTEYSTAPTEAAVQTDAAPSAEDSVSWDDSSKVSDSDGAGVTDSESEESKEEWEI